MAHHLPLHDIHLDTAPAWWPPAPGWWWLSAAVVLMLLAWGSWRYWRWQRRRQLQQLFDTTVNAHSDAAAQLAAMSELLRRAARRIDVQADHLQGAQWQSLLEDTVQPAALPPAMSQYLAQGLWQRQTDSVQIDAIKPAVRQRFLAWMGALK